MDVKSSQRLPAIDFFGSEGFEIDLEHDGQHICGATPRAGHINHYDLISVRTQHFNRWFESHQRITKPLRKVNGDFVEISFEEAFDSIEKAIKQVAPSENAFFAGARLSNEMLYQIQKIARGGIGSNNIGSFHYLGRNSQYYNLDKNDNVQLEELESCDAIVVLGNGVKETRSLADLLIQKAHNDNNIPLIHITEQAVPGSKQNKDITVLNYYSFLKALNHYILTHKLQRGIFVAALSQQFESYKEQLLQENFEELLRSAGISETDLIRFLKAYLELKNVIVVYSESDISGHCVRELLNLCLFTEKLGIPYSGVLGVKEKNNSQGLFDMGIESRLGVGGNAFTPKLITQLKDVWGVKSIATDTIDIENSLLLGKSKNVFIFGEDPVGCASESTGEGLLDKAEFIVVQDYFLTATALKADIVLPDTFPYETGGSFTNTTKILQQFTKGLPAPVALSNIEQLSQLGTRFGIATEELPEMVFFEFLQFLPTGCTGGTRHKFVYTPHDSQAARFRNGCDALMSLNI